MRIRLSFRVALLATVTVVLTAVGALPYPHSSTSTYAAPVHDLSTPNFKEVALQGFGDRANSWAWAMQWYKDQLYVGTNRNYECTEEAMLGTAVYGLGRIVFPYPPHDPNVQCPGSPPTLSQLPPTLGAQIWSVNPAVAVNRTTPLTQNDWHLAFRSLITVPMKVQYTIKHTLGPRDMGFRAMSVYDNGGPNGPSLYVSGVGARDLAGAKVPPPSLLYTTDGTQFQAAPAMSGTTLGDINTLSTLPPLLGNPKLSTGGCCFRGQVSYQGRFFVIIGDIQGAGAVFESPTPDLGNDTFQQITPMTMQVFEMEPFNGSLYLGVQSLQGGYEVLKTNCVAPPQGQPWCPPSAFSQPIVPPGGGLGANGNFSVTSMHVYTTTDSVGHVEPHLYVGTNGALNQQAGEIVRINTDDSWDLIVGNARTYTDPATGDSVTKTPLSSLNSGFGWPLNYHMWRMADMQSGGVDTLYVGTFDDSSMYISSPISSTLEPNIGFDLYASTDGVTFSPVTTNGFGDPFSMGARSLEPTPYGLFVGSANPWYGLRIWQGTPLSAGMEHAPATLQSARMEGHTTLHWQASDRAVRYHIYRTTLQRVTLPPMPEGDTDVSASSRARPHVVWLPSAYTEIGSATGPSFVDTEAPAYAPAMYFVVAEDATGRLSAPSNVTESGQ